MQHLARRLIIRQLSQALVLTVAVGHIADQREAEKLEVDPDLVGSTGMQNCFGEGRPSQAFQHAVSGARLCCAPATRVLRAA